MREIVRPCFFLGGEGGGEGGRRGGGGEEGREGMCMSLVWISNLIISQFCEVHMPLSVSFMPYMFYAASLEFHRILSFVIMSLFQHHVTCVNFILTRHRQLVLFGWAKVISPNCSYFKIGIIVKYGYAIRLQPSTSSPGSPLTTGGEKTRDPGNEFIMYKPKLSLQQNMPMTSFNIPILKNTGLWWWKMCLTTVCDGNSEFCEVEGKVNYTPEVHVNFKIYLENI